MVFGMFAGLRPSKILRLDWSMIKFDQVAIAVPRHVARKVRTSQLVPIERNLMAWLGLVRTASYPARFIWQFQDERECQDKRNG
jgi:integrase